MVWASLRMTAMRLVMRRRTPSYCKLRATTEVSSFKDPLSKSTKREKTRIIRTWSTT